MLAAQFEIVDHDVQRRNVDRLTLQQLADRVGILFGQGQPRQSRIDTPGIGRGRSAPFQVTAQLLCIERDAPIAWFGCSRDAGDHLGQRPTGQLQALRPQGDLVRCIAAVERFPAEKSLRRS